jgi:hypothetical protein
LPQRNFFSCGLLFRKILTVAISSSVCVCVFDRSWQLQLRWEDLVVSTTYNNQTTTNNHVVTSITTPTTVGDYSPLGLAGPALPGKHSIRQQHLHPSRKVRI